MTQTLNLRLLGSFQASLDDQPLRFTTSKAQALLCYLAVTGESCSRESLVELLWGDMPERKARRNLTTALTSLRKQLEPYLNVEPNRITFNFDASHQLDVSLFQDAIKIDVPSDDLTPLRQAVELYQGDFLAGFYVRQAVTFEEWVLAERARLRELMLHALQQLVAQAIDRADYAAGLDYAGRLLEAEPWHETAHRQMMRLLARSGRRDAALTQYESCRLILAEELGVEPMAETTALYERLKMSDTPPPHNLPPSPNGFVGREVELVYIASQLNDPACRLLTLVGPGGIGKTRLALESATHHLKPEARLDGGLFTDGIFFVNLTSVENLEVATPAKAQTAHALVSAIGEALSLTFQGSANILAQLLHYLQAKDMLLILDNFEHLITTSENTIDVLLEILRMAPHIKVLVTSRERLNLQEEWTIHVEGLAYPGGAEAQSGDSLSLTNYQEYNAIDLFMQRAQQANAGFALSEQSQADVGRIAQLVQGVPLALELAASWLLVLSVAEIATEIEQSLDFLTTSWRNVPRRHRSLRAVFEQSWRMLSPPEQTAFCALSVFRGGFRREAAQRVARASLPILAGLVNKSLLRLTASGRYEIHELLRQFTAEQLLHRTADVVEEDTRSSQATPWERHSHYYLELITQQEAALFGPQPQQTVAELRIEMDNIRQAWRWAVTHGHGHLMDIEASIDAVVTFYELSGLFQEAEENFSAAAAVFNRSSTNAEPQADLICHLLIKQAWFISLLGNYDQVKATIASALRLVEQAESNPLRLAEGQAILGQAMVFCGEMNEAIAQLKPAMITYRELDQPRQLAFTLGWLGEAYARTQLFDKALESLQEALQIDKQLDNKRGQAFDYGAIANVYSYQDRPDIALSYQQNALTLYEELAYPFGIGGILNNIGLAYYHSGRYPEALEALKRALQLFRQMSNAWDEANTLENLGAVYTVLGDYGQAQQSLEQALVLFDGSKMGEAYVAYRLGRLYLEKGDYQQSRFYFQRGIALGEAMDDTKLAATCIGELGFIDHREHILERASAQYQRAISQLKAVGSRFDTAKFMVQQAVLLFEKGQLDQAQADLQEGLQLAQEVGDTFSVFEGQLLQAKITYSRGEQTAAVEQLKVLIALSNDEVQQAALQYELWKMGQGLACARSAIAHYQQLYTRTPNIVYRERLAELQATLV